MSTVIKSHPWLAGMLGIALALAIALPVYAHCGKCAVDAKAMAEELTKSKMSLAAAATLAEVSTKGTAVQAAVHKHKEGAFVEVHCMVGDKIMAVEVCAKSGKILQSKAVKTLDEHASGEIEVQAKSPIPPEAIRPTAGVSAETITKASELLSKTKMATEEGRLADAESSLMKLESMKSMLPANLQKQIDAARKAYDVAKAAKSVIPEEEY